MAWAKLDNPKPSAANNGVGPDSFKIAARDAPTRKDATAKPKRFITIKLGMLLCSRASFIHKEHKVHLMKGSGEDEGKLAVVLDDSGGKFVAKKKADGRYEINVGELAAAGKFSTTFPPFGGIGTLMNLPSVGKVITLTATPEFLAA